MPRVLFTYPWAPADYRADTRHLTREQHYAYREILDEIFLTGQNEDPPSIPDDDDLLASVAMASSPEEWAQTRRVLIDGPRAVLQSQSGRISQRRMSAEIAKALAKCDTNRTNASKRWQGRPETAIESKKSVPDGGSNGGNGHGQATMSTKQFRFYASRVAKWLEDHRGFFAGSESGAFERAFEQGIGISWKSWEREKSVHDADA